MNDEKILDCHTKLLPCPFCGNDNVHVTKKPLWQQTDYTIVGYKGCYEFEVICDRCGAHPNYSTNDTTYRSEKEAIVDAVNRWNNRSMEPFVKTDENILDDKSERQHIVSKLESIVKEAEFLLTQFKEPDAHYRLHSIAAEACHLLNGLSDKKEQTT